MKILKSVAVAALSLAVGIGGATVAVAKGHDQGVADGFPTPENTGLFSRDGFVAGVDVLGIGAESELFGLCQEGFCGVVGDPGQTYGRDIVSVQRELGIRRVTPNILRNDPGK
jgi:hypothetical protein